jgi:nucleoside-diphosphate-sugar epimerase
MPIERANDVYGSSSPALTPLRRPDSPHSLCAAASKALAEKAAWEFVKQPGVDFTFSRCAVLLFSLSSLQKLTLSFLLASPRS